ncbi:phosphotransferase family protein [Cobetia crustatorum]|uniref:phosphotransferase family protein n=1 Tax=Cobetia crustatorum TaxID=553385 RepID=UPI00046A3BC0|nr:phosphotransferase [Cobetia crustatorum]
MTSFPITDPLTRLHDGLVLALEAQNISHTAIQALPDSGLAHAHLRVTLANGTTWMARLPKQSQMRLAAEENLTYQRTCFARCQPSGNTPQLHHVLPPNEDLPRGGLLVEAIEGRPARLPEDLPAIMATLASLHALPLPEQAHRSPLLAPDSPWQAMLSEINTQCDHLASAGITGESQALIETERRALESFVSSVSAPTAVSLISFDAHPGNFLIEHARHTQTGQPPRAVLVDLEKCRYGLPGFDLAHATLYTSTTWDIASYAVLTPEEVVSAYRHWRAQMHAAGADEQLITPDTLMQARRAMWLWSVSWCAKWLALNQQTQDTGHSGEDWSGELSEEALIVHVRERARHYLSTESITCVTSEWHQLASALHA